MSGLSKVIAKLERLSGPDSRVDEMIWEAIGGWPEREYRSVNYMKAFGTPVTGSLDAAVALVERVRPGWKKQFFEDYNGLWIARISSPRRDLYSTDYMRERDPGGSSNGAIALCLALLRSLEGRDE